MVKEARRAVVELGAVSVRNPFLPEGKYLHEPEYDALWEAACELDFDLLSRRIPPAPFSSL